MGSRAVEVFREFAETYQIREGTAEPHRNAARIAKETEPDLWDYPRLFWQMVRDCCPPLLPFDIAGLLVFEIADHLTFHPVGPGTQGEEAARDMDMSRHWAAYRCALLALPHEFAVAGVIPRRFPRTAKERAEFIGRGCERIWLWKMTVLSPACDPVNEARCPRLLAIRGLIRSFGKTHYPGGVGRHFDIRELGHDAETALKSAGLPDVGGAEFVKGRMKKGLSVHFFNGKSGKARIAWHALRDEICKEQKLPRRRERRASSLNAPLPSGSGERGDLVAGTVASEPQRSEEVLALGVLIGLEVAEEVERADERWDAVEEIEARFSQGPPADRAAVLHEAFGIAHAKKGRGRQEFSFKRLAEKFGTSPKAIRWAAKRLQTALSVLRRPSA